MNVTAENDLSACHSEWENSFLCPSPSMLHYDSNSPNILWLLLKQEVPASLQTQNQGLIAQKNSVSWDAFY